MQDAGQRRNHLRHELWKGCSTPSLGVTTPKTWASRHWEPDSLVRWNGTTCQLRDYDGQPTAEPGSSLAAKRRTPSSPPNRRSVLA